MGDHLVLEGTEGVGKTLVKNEIIHRLIETLGWRLLVDYSSKAESSPRDLMIDRRIVDQVAFYSSQIIDSNVGYILNVAEPSKQGIESLLRTIFLEGHFAGTYNSLIYALFYNLSRSVTYWSILPALREFENVLVLADRCGLTTEAMQPPDLLVQAWFDLLNSLNFPPDEQEVEKVVECAIDFLRREGGEKRERIKNSLAALSVASITGLGMDLETAGAIGEEILERRQKFVEIWMWIRQNLEVVRQIVDEGNIIFSGVQYPTEVLVFDLPRLIISRARSCGRYLIDGYVNFRDLLPEEISREITTLYRDIGPRFVKNSVFINCYCPIEVVCDTVMRHLGDVLFRGYEGMGDLLEREKYGIHSAGELVSRTTGMTFTPFHLRDVTEEQLRERVPNVVRWLGLTEEQVYRAVHEAKRMGSDLVLADLLLAEAKLPDWRVLHTEMEKIWRWGEGIVYLTPEGYSAGPECEGTGGQFCEADM